MPEQLFGPSRNVPALLTATGYVPASHAARSRPRFRQSTCRDRCRKTSAPHPASPQPAQCPPSPCRKDSRQACTGQTRAKGFVESEHPQAQACGRSSSSSGVARTPRTNEYRNSSRHLSLDGTLGYGHTALNVLMNLHHLFPFGPLFPQRAFFVFACRTFKRHFKSVRAFRTGRPVQPMASPLRAGSQVRIPCGGLPESFRRGEPGSIGRRDTTTATDDHDSTSFLNRLMK